MILQAKFDELNEIVRRKASVKGLSLSYCSPDTAQVSFTLNILGMSPSVSADVKIFSVEGSRVTAEVDAGNLGGFILDKARNLLLEKTPAGLVERFDGKQAVLNLEAIPELKSVFENVAVRGLSFTEDAVCLDASLRSSESFA